MRSDVVLMTIVMVFLVGSCTLLGFAKAPASTGQAVAAAPVDAITCIPWLGLSLIAFLAITNRKGKGE